MRKGNLFVLVVFTLTAAAFAAGMATLFMLRFEAGDIYPPYSSLRSDPLGTKAFYKSLLALDGVRAWRSFRPPDQAPLPSDGTLFLLGVDPGMMCSLVPRKTMNVLDQFVFSGGRVVLSFIPVPPAPQRPPEEQPAPGHDLRGPDERQSPPGEPGDDPPGEPCESASKDDRITPKPAGPADVPSGEEPERSLAEHWGITPAFAGSADGETRAARTCAGPAVPLPDSFSWHTFLHFAELIPPWKTVYAVKEHPVVIERTWGRGTIVALADSYVFSNEALRKEPQPGLLSWLLGAHRQAIFDEFHLGIRRRPGIAALARTYRLHWPLASVLLLAGLFVWKNAFSFVPPRDHEYLERRGTAASRRDYAEGLISLLRRGISQRDLLPVCFNEWKQTFFHRKRHSPETVTAVTAIVNTTVSEERDPVAGYQAISHLLSERKRL